MVGARQNLGQAEVEDLHHIRLRHHHVRRLEVAMNDAARVGMRDGIGDLQTVAEDVCKREAAGGNQLIERSALDQLQGDVCVPVGLPNFVDRADVRMIQRGGGARFAHQAQPRVRIANGCRQQFDRHVAIKAIVVRPVHLAHPTRAEQRIDAIKAEPRTTCKTRRRPGSAKRWRVAESSGVAVSGEHLFDIGAERDIAGARFGQNGRTVAAVARPREVEQRRDLPPPFRRHDHR
jgi:hypothetical protein